MYQFDEEKLIQQLQERKPQRVLLQLPEGLKKEGIRLSKLIEEKGNVEVILSGEPVWGACDVAVNEARSLGCDLIILYGHAPFMKIDFPILYLEARFEVDVSDLLKRALPLLKEYQHLGLVSSVQHLHQLSHVKNFFEEHGKKVSIPLKKGHAFYDGQVLGCEYHPLKLLATEVDVFFMIANKFHALGAALSVKQPVFLLDPYTHEIVNMSSLREKTIKQRFAAIEKAKQAKNIGIIIGLKIGQKFGSFTSIKDKLKKIGKKSVLIVMNEVTNDKLINLYDIDAFVELACPRIAIEDVAKYSKPLLTAREFAVLCGDISWNDLLQKGFL